MHRSLAIRLVVLLMVVATACTRTRGDDIPSPPTLPQTTDTTEALVDLSGIALPTVPGRTTTTVVLGPGRANISGSVTGPEGPVAEATVRVERLVGEGSASIDVLTAPDGTWATPAVLGGRYRVRAWRSPDLALTTPALFFMEATETKVLELGVTRYQGYNVTAAITPNPPLLDGPASLVVQVTERRVDESGIVRATPVAGLDAEVFGPGDWRVRGANPTLTDSAGRARWHLVCRRVGEQALSVSVGGVPFPLNLPQCAAPPPSPDDDDEPGAETTVPGTGRAPATTTTSIRATTTTARASTTRPSTTTTRPSTTSTAPAANATTTTTAR